MEKDVKSALDNAFRWYSTAQEAYVAKNYDNAVYALEMSLEIGLKAILIRNGVEYPKIHDVSGVVRPFLTVGTNKNRTDQSTIDKMLGSFQVLLMYRNAAGYMFSNNVSMDTLKRVADDNIKKVESYLKILSEISAK